MTTILGINHAYHESSACIIKDGVIVAMAEEERFNRKKHAKPARTDNPDELPVNAIRFCLERAKITWNDLDYIASSFNPGKRLKNKTFGDRAKEGDWGSESGEALFYKKLRQVPKKLSALYGTDIRKKFRWVGHHDAHAASAYFVSPFREAAILVADGIGETESTTLYRGTGRKMKKLKSIHYPNSLGFLWEKIAKFLGFTEYDACKIMGLASYGDAKRYYKKLKTFIKIGGVSFKMDPRVLEFRAGDCRALEKMLGRRRKPGEELEGKHADIAAALQKVTEEILLRLAADLHRLTKSANLCLAGGVALNCVANRILQEKGPFKKIYIQPAAHDAGTAIGAAYFIWNQMLEKPRGFVMEHAYVGPDFSSAKIKRALDESGLKYARAKNITKKVAKLVADGNIVGWFQGRMEAGPRALGNRTLLADPRNPKIRDILNMKVKHREYFRPFAPSVLAEKAREWFRIPAESMASDFMLFAYDALEEKQRLIPAVIHVDGTSRIQTVRRKTNSKYHRLIREFEKITGVPMILNTSLNDREPIVCSPEDAISTFQKTRIDYLAIGDFLIARSKNNG